MHSRAAGQAASNRDVFLLPHAHLLPQHGCSRQSSDPKSSMGLACAFPLIFSCCCDPIPQQPSLPNPQKGAVRVSDCTEIGLCPPSTLAQERPSPLSTQNGDTASRDTCPYYVKWYNFVLSMKRQPPPFLSLAVCSQCSLRLAFLSTQRILSSPIPCSNFCFLRGKTFAPSGMTGGRAA